ncbi:serine hydrolase [Sphingomonas xanthus]|uniref:Beta-lactamase n=1 Tax=Sphingomonas xanthus TaxID=2594473 RepID=A0A516IQS1_9SPHN|nr:serine hydrolase [Sphingomonas xanthus]QDP19241.1 serine hydrolase [Sphingomonas xanthus]
MRLKGLACFLIALAAQPALAASSPALEPLERQLQTLAAQRPGNVGIAALDLKTGELIGVAPDEPFPMASTVKIAVAANYLAQVEHGRRTLDRQIGGVSAARLMDAMMTRSDNHATDLLLRDLGGPATVQAWLRQQGLEGLRIDRNIARLLADKRDLSDIRDSSTPRAMVDLLKRIDQATLLSRSNSDYLLDMMARCRTGKNRIRALLPSGTPVQNKTGTLNRYSSDVGFITLPDGRRLAVAFFARNTNNGPSTIAWAARTVYDGFVRVMQMPFTYRAAAGSYASN